MEIREISFPSSDGKQKIHAVQWRPEGEPKAILQLVHGMAEHIERYDDFAKFMAKHGYLVVGDNHLGHGKSVGATGQRGYFCEKDAASVLVRDEHRLHEELAGEYPAKPYFILGHSMGSFITRNYLCDYGREVNAAVIMGTGMQPKALLRVSKFIAGVEGAVRGEHHVSKFMNKVGFGSYCKRIPDATDANDWLTTDPEVVKAYNADPDCGFVFTVNGFKTLFELIDRLHDADRLAKMPKELPLLFVSGAEDPVGDYTKGVELAVASVEKAGMRRVSKKYYPGMRHEILNEKEHNIVYEDMLSFFDGILEAL